MHTKYNAFPPSPSCTGGPRAASREDMFETLLQDSPESLGKGGLDRSSSSTGTAMANPTKTKTVACNRSLSMSWEVDAGGEGPGSNSNSNANSKSTPGPGPGPGRGRGHLDDSRHLHSSARSLALPHLPAASMETHTTPPPTSSSSSHLRHSYHRHVFSDAAAAAASSVVSSSAVASAIAGALAPSSAHQQQRTQQQKQQLQQHHHQQHHHHHHQQQQQQHHHERQYLAALTLAGVAITLLSTTFDLFHLETFFDAYALPLESYARGNIIYTVVSAVNDLFGAWLVDSMELRSSDRRGTAMAMSGYVLAGCFALPFFRWRWSGGGGGGSRRGSHRAMDAAHFALTLSAYDSALTFATILIGSMFTDMHHLTESARVRFMASGKAVNMGASLVVAKVGLSTFDTADMYAFRLFVVALALASCALFAIARDNMPPSGGAAAGDSDEGNAGAGANVGVGVGVGVGVSVIVNANMSGAGVAVGVGSATVDPAGPRPARARKHKPRRRKLDVRAVARDLASHPNFRRWAVAEMLLEAQTSFGAAFLKEFVDRLLRPNGASDASCDWLLSSIRPLAQVAGIALYVPIRKVGYRRVYMAAFQAKFALSLLAWAFGSPKSRWIVASFLTIDSVLTPAVQSCGFHLAMADMVAELKLDQMREGRYDEPSLAGFFMGVNAMLCKPMCAFLPVVVAWSLTRAGYAETAKAASPAAAAIVPGSAEMDHVATAESEERVQSALFYLMVGPSLLFSVVQILAWSKYNLDGKRSEEVRIELKELQEKYYHEDELVP